ncbi:MAG: RepB-like protein, partial [Lactococcus lactis]|nr:RepB-like protein [Lactococcus lactis]
FTSKKGNTVYVDVDGQKAIKNAFFNKTSTKKHQQKVFIDDNVNDSIDSVSEEKEEILFLRNLVSELQLEKKEIHKLLDQQQRLALQDKKLLEEYKAENDSLKALKMPSQETKEELVDNQSQEVTNVVEATTKVPRKWWQFWR